MQARILSDLHINQNGNFDLTDKEIFTIVAGDISKDFFQLESWLQQNIKNGIFILGNHDFTGNTNMIDAYRELKEKFPVSNNLTFLQNSCKEIDNKIFVGATLWTDFSLEVNNPMTSKSVIKNLLHGYIRGNFSKEQKLTPEITIKEYMKSINYIDFICKENPDKDIIVITHHCPSIKCSAEKFKNNVMNPALITNLESFILEHKNIKAWCCGHCHRNPIITEIGNCKIIMNTKGYTKYNECPNFDENFIVEI